MKMIIDTHAHLNTDEFKSKIDDSLKLLKEHHVDYVIVVGMNHEANLRAIKLAFQHKELYATVGIHPCDIKNEKIEDLIPLLKEKKVVALGEIGIDLYWKKDNLEDQKKIFIQQIELAIQHDLPIIIHTRESFKEAYECVLPYKGKLRGVFHSFSSNIEDAKRAIELGFYIGISGVVTFKKALELHEIVKEIDLKHMLVETDSPWLAPVPYRGKRNEPAYTYYVVEEIAKIKNISSDEVAKITSNNAKMLFRLEI